MLVCGFCVEICLDVVVAEVDLNVSGSIADLS